jgi:hypothetical protein
MSHSCREKPAQIRRGRYEKSRNQAEIEISRGFYRLGSGTSNFTSNQTLIETPRVRSALKVTLD